MSGKDVYSRILEVSSKVDTKRMVTKVMPKDNSESSFSTREQKGVISNPTLNLMDAASSSSTFSP